jgi:hypothetical protein
MRLAGFTRFSGNGGGNSNKLTLFEPFRNAISMKVKIVESNSQQLPQCARIRQVLEDQAKLVIECEDDSAIRRTSTRELARLA